MARVSMRSARALGLLAVLSVVGLAYLLVGFISALNWYAGIASADQQLYPDLIPGDLGFALVALTIGASLTASTRYALRGDQAMHLTTAACGTWLALGALVIQVMAATAALLDAIVVGESIDHSMITTYLLRMDVILGSIVLPISIPYTLALSRMCRRGK